MYKLSGRVALSRKSVYFGARKRNFSILMNILSRVSFDHVICMFPFLFCRWHSKTDAVNQIIHPGFHKSLTTDYLNVTGQKIKSSIKDFFSK